MEETFEINITKKTISNDELTDTEDEGSEISDLEDIVEIDDIDHLENLQFLTESFESIAEIKSVGYREFKISFNDQNVKLTDNEEGVYEFEENKNGYPILQDATYFIPFVNYLSKLEPCLIGVTIFTNLEGGGSLII